MRTLSAGHVLTVVRRQQDQRDMHRSGGMDCFFRCSAVLFFFWGGGGELGRALACASMSGCTSVASLGSTVKGYCPREASLCRTMMMEYLGVSLSGGSAQDSPLVRCGNYAVGSAVHPAGLMANIVNCPQTRQAMQFTNIFQCRIFTRVRRTAVGVLVSAPSMWLLLSGADVAWSVKGLSTFSSEYYMSHALKRLAHRTVRSAFARTGPLYRHAAISQYRKA